MKPVRPAVANRVSPSPAGSIPPSCLHDVFRTAEERELATGRPVIKLHVGEPYFRSPPEAVAAFTAAVRDGRTAYTSAEGLMELREALAAKLEDRNGHRSSPDRIFITPGSCQGLAALLQSLVHPGDELLMPELHCPSTSSSACSPDSARCSTRWREDTGRTWTGCRRWRRRGHARS